MAWSLEKLSLTVGTKKATEIQIHFPAADDSFQQQHFRAWHNMDIGNLNTSKVTIFTLKCGSTLFSDFHCHVDV